MKLCEVSKVSLEANLGGKLRHQQGTYRHYIKAREPNVTLILLEGQRIRAVMRIVLGPR